LTEQDIILEILEGNLEAYADLVRAHQVRVRLACLVWLGNPEEADDAAQDIFIKAFKALGNFKGDSTFQTWILRIADNHCRDLLRAKTRHRTESLDAILSEKGNVFEGLLARTLGSDDLPAYSPDELQLLGRLFAALPEEDCEILALREVEELPYEAIAERLHCTLDAVKGRLKRARQTLIDKCQKHFPDTSNIPTRL